MFPFLHYTNSSRTPYIEPDPLPSRPVFSGKFLYYTFDSGLPTFLSLRSPSQSDVTPLLQRLPPSPVSPRSTPRRTRFKDSVLPRTTQLPQHSSDYRIYLMSLSLNEKSTFSILLVFVTTIFTRFVLTTYPLSLSVSLCICITLYVRLPSLWFFQFPITTYH